jgi:O-antigen/teichoic acid export membrane protein
VNPLKKLLGQTAIYGLSSIVGRLLNYLLVPLYTRYFTTSEYGDVTLLYAYAAFLLIILSYGIETAFFRFSQREPNKRVVYSTALISLLISSSLFVGFIYFNAQSIANTLSFGQHPEYIQYFAFIIGLDTLSSISFAKLRELNQATRFALIRLLNIFINIGLNLFFIIYCPFAINNNLPTAEFIQSFYSPSIGIGYIFIANLVSSVVTILMLVPEMSKSLWRFDKALWRKMMVYALPLMVAGLAGITNETIDRILLQYLLPADISASEIGLYSAFYKLSIIMTLFVQTFRFAAEPFFFSQERERNAKQVYAQVMKYFSIVTAFIFLSVMIYYDLVKQFIGTSFHDERGATIVPILLLANLFLGLYYNLSVWYKLTEKTSYGAYMSLFGAAITIVLNLVLIPYFGFVGSAWATLCCYFLMALCSYFLGQKYYPIPYPLGRIAMYFGLVLGFYFLSAYLSLGMAINTFFLIFYIVVVYVLEKPKKRVISNPQLFD